MMTRAGVEVGRHTYGTKYQAPIAQYLYHACDPEEESGDVDHPGGWFARVGRRIYGEDSQGFVWSTKFDTVEDAREAFRDADEAYSVWADADD